MIKAVIFDMYETLITLFESPLYFGTEIAEDAGLPGELFTTQWRLSEIDRTTGKITVDEVIEKILRDNNRYTEERFNQIISKRIAFKEEVFNHMHPEIIPMLEALRDNGIKIGLISNCYSEEAMVIKKSILYKYFDAVCLSYDDGIRKPDHKIYRLCLERLNLRAEECLYVGDGGSNELAAAGEVGMKPAQAVWYLKEGTRQPAKRMPEYLNLEKPFEIVKLILSDARPI